MIVVMGGPTAAGKSALALAVAERINGEIIGADSRQLYRGLPIAAAAPTRDQRACVPHHLYETIDPTLPQQPALSAALFLSLADDVISEVEGRGKVAIVVGGTGLYLRALRLGLDPALPSDTGLKQTLLGDLAADGLAAMVARLRAVDVVAAESIDRHNPVRVVRALEIALLGSAGSRPSLQQARFLLVDADGLAERIDARTRAMFHNGIVDEASALAGALPLEHALLHTIGIQEALEVALGVSNIDNAVEATATRTRQYARRQRTWFHKEPWWTRVSAADVDGACAAIAANP